MLSTKYRSPSVVPAQQQLWREGRANIEVEDGLSRRLGFSGIVVDDIANLLPLSVDVARDVPIMSIERRFRPESTMLEILWCLRQAVQGDKLTRMRRDISSP